MAKCVFGWENSDKLSKYILLHLNALIDNVWMAIIWPINVRSPNSPMFFAANVSLHVAMYSCKILPWDS